MANLRSDRSETVPEGQLEDFELHGLEHAGGGDGSLLSICHCRCLFDPSPLTAAAPFRMLSFKQVETLAAVAPGGQTNRRPRAVPESFDAR